jgi:hypothetical protein
MYLIPMEAYQHWERLYRGTQVLVLPLTAAGVEKVV